MSRLACLPLLSAAIAAIAALVAPAPASAQDREGDPYAPAEEAPRREL